MKIMTAAYHPLIVLLVSAVLLIHKIPALGQDFTSPEDEFDSIFTPLSQVEGSICARYHNWNRGTVSPLSQDQLLLFRDACAAVSLADVDWLKNLVTDIDNYLDMYSFVSNIRQLAQNDIGVKYLFQAPFDDKQRQHRRLASNLSSEPDAIVGVFWCQPMGENAAPRFTGGYAYLKRRDGDWKFQTR